MRPIKFRSLLPLLLFFSGVTPVYADIALLLHQPHSTFGFFNPTGHASLYLSRVCAETPVLLRSCGDGELGVVISRYNKIAGYDWLAIPLIPFMYAVDHPEQVPDYIDHAGVKALRDTWQRSHLREIVPDAFDASGSKNGKTPKGHWKQLVGAAYDRKIYGFIIETEEASDDALIEMLNGRANKRRFNMFFNNCADFAKDIINFYYPKSIRRNFIADIGLTTQKHVTKSFVRLSQRNPDLRFSTFIIPQVEGDLGRSTAARGVMESLAMSKQYAAPLVVFYPWVAVGSVAAYVTKGRFNPEKHTHLVLSPVELAEFLHMFSESDRDESPVTIKTEAHVTGP